MFYNRKYLVTGAFVICGIGAASPANASYMSNCNELISAWQTCSETSESCTAEYSAIEKECKCHAFKQGEWKLVMAAVGKDNVCESTPVDPPPPPPEPPKRKPVITYGGERGPDNPAPNKADHDKGDRNKGERQDD